MAGACSAVVTTRIRSGGTLPANRSVHSAMSGFSLTMVSMCFGVLLRLSGQNLVPEPPAMMTA